VDCFGRQLRTATMAFTLSGCVLGLPGEGPKLRPQPRVEEIGKLDGCGADCVWVPGHWYWAGGDYVWQPGRAQRATPLELSARREP